MLRICYSLTETGPQWILCGQLAGPWVQELRSCWEHSTLTAGAPHSIVDLSDVTFIDENGEGLLSDMRSRGVEFVATGIETKDLLENLKGQGERPLRRRIGRSTDGAHPCGGKAKRETETR